MNLLALRTSARKKAGDTARPYKWSNAQWDEAANEAEVDACRRARLILDSQTPEVVEIDITSGEALYQLHESVIFVRRVKLASKSLPLPKVSRKDLDCLGDWESATGEIEGYSLDYQTGWIRFYREPTAADTAYLLVVRAPLEDMAADGDEPEIPKRFHPALVQGMLERYYSSDDPEVEDSALAEKHAALFTQEFGRKSTAIDEQWINEHHGYDVDEGLF